jgi:hypothetical protein
MVKRSGILSRDLKTISRINLVYSKLRKRLVKVQAALPDGARTTAVLPVGGESTSVEEALNSRCTGDRDGRSKSGHWGLLDPSRKLSKDDVERVAAAARSLRLTTPGTRIDVDGDDLVFLADRRASGIERDWQMIEDGMRQQAALLVCSALGIGASIRGYGPEGASVSDRWRTSVRIKVRPVMPSYGGSYWTRRAPGPIQKWTSGNLPDPLRAGTTPLLAALRGVPLQAREGGTATRKDLGQVLWAGRGRTPHYYHSVPWGLTIPTYGGRQDGSSLAVILDGHLLSYRNWHNRRPTHSLVPAKVLDEASIRELRRRHAGGDCWLIVSVKEARAMHFWETGCQLMNMLLQAHVLDLGYRAILLEESERRFLGEHTGVAGPAALFVLRTEGP